MTNDRPSSGTDPLDDEAIVNAYNRITMRTASALLLTLASALAPGACVPISTLPPGDIEPTDGNRDLDPDTLGAGKFFGEPNGSFALSITAVFDNLGRAHLQGTVDSQSDLDVFVLGAVNAGDRLTVDAATPIADLDVSIALFDAQGRLVFTNDDRSDALVTASDYDSLIENFVVRRAGDPYYLVVTASAFAGSNNRRGGYRVEVAVTRGTDVPDPVGQWVLLDFRGATVDIPALGPTLVAPFSAAAISGVYTGRDSDLKEQITLTTQENFRRFNVTVRSSDDGPLPAGIEYSTMYLGGFNGGLFGIAQSVDDYNSDYCDDGIIFAETFRPSIFSQTPTVEELGIAIGNVTAHEAGHLLGLNHTDDDRDIMDARSAADAFIEDQEFMEAPLSADIMTIGTQDSALLLYETVGPSSSTRALRRTGGQ